MNSDKLLEAAHTFAQLLQEGAIKGHPKAVKSAEKAGELELAQAEAIVYLRVLSSCLQMFNNTLFDKKTKNVLLKIPFVGILI